MAAALPLYLVGALPEGVEPILADEGSGDGAVVHGIPGIAAFPGPDHSPGWVILSPRMSDPDALELIRRLGDLPGPWSPLLLRDGGDAGFHLLPVSPGFPTSVVEFRDQLRENHPRATLSSFRLVVKHLARIRHDVNNPLTAALAEVQLLLMDHEDGTEGADGLRIVEAQLKRIRDMVAQLASFRVSGL